MSVQSNSAMLSKPLAHWVDGPADAPVIVLIHPIATHSAIWATQMAVWSSIFRVVRIDLPGHGASEPSASALNFQGYAQKVADVLDALAINKAAFVGLSLGGMVAQAFALAWPQRVSALVLAHTSARTEPAVRDLWERRIEQFQAQGIDGIVTATLERWFTRDFLTTAPLTMAFVADQIRTTSAAGYEAAVRAIQDLNHLDRLSEIKSPTLVIAGAQDSAVPPAAASALAAKISNAQFVTLEDAAHIGNLQQPTRFTEIVGGFLSQALLAKPE